MKTYFKLFGLRRSGTNYTKWLLENNFNYPVVLQNILGHKHLPPSEKIDWSGKSWIKECVPQPTENEIKEIQFANERGDLHFLIIIKNPYSWIISICNHIKVPVTNENIKKQIEIWNTANQDFLNIVFNPEYKNVAVVRYEDLINNTTGILNYFKFKYGISQSNDEYQFPKFKTEKGGELPINLTNVIANNEYYEKEQYLEKFKEGQIRLISNLVNKELLYKLQYEIMNGFH